MSITINVTPLATGSVAASASQDSVSLTVQSGIGPVGPQGVLVGGTGIDASFANGNSTVTLNATLSDLADVSAAAPTSGQVLTYNGSAWTAAADSTNLTGYATESFVTSAVANLVDSSPAALDTLNELAAALGDDPNFSATITASLAGKADASHTHNLADLADVSGTPSTNQALIYNGSEWQPGDVPAGTTINNLSGSVVLANGTGITLTESGQTLTLAAVAQGGDVDGGTFGAAGNVLTEGGDNLAAETGDTLTVEGGSATAGDSIQLLRSNVAGATPSSLLAGEMAINTEDGLLYWQRANGTIASADIDLTLATVATTGSYNDLSGIPTEFTPAAHTHTSGDVTDFGTAAAANAPLQSINTLTGTLTIAGSGGTTVTESGSTITVASTAPPTNLADLSDVSTATPSTNQVLKWNGSAWAPAADATNGTGGGGGGYGSLLLFG